MDIPPTIENLGDSPISLVKSALQYPGVIKLIEFTSEEIVTKGLLKKLELGQ